MVRLEARTFAPWALRQSLHIAGLAILSKVKPLSVDKTLPGHPDPKIAKGRIITLEFETCYLIGTYVVNAGAGLKVIQVELVLALLSLNDSLLLDA